MRPVLLKAARDILGMSQEKLSAMSGIPLSTLKRIEAPGNTKRARRETLETLERFFAATGVTVLDTPDVFGAFIDRSGELSQLAAILEQRDRAAGLYRDGEAFFEEEDGE